MFRLLIIIEYELELNFLIFLWHSSLMYEVRNRENEIKSLKSEEKLEVRSPKAEVQSEKSEDLSMKSEVWRYLSISVPSAGFSLQIPLKAQEKKPK